MTTDSPVSCPGNLTPTIPTDAPNSIFCCDQASCVNDWHTCIDYLGTGCAEPDICSEIYTSYLQWYASECRHIGHAGLDIDFSRTVVTQKHRLVFPTYASRILLEQWG